MKFWIFFFSILFFGCSYQPKQPHSSKQVLRMSINREPHSLDPRIGGEVVSVYLHFLLFEGLTRFNPDWTIALAAAESIEISKDRKTYIFYLKQAKWSDGSPVTAFDFAYAWKKILDPLFPAINAYLFFCIKNGELAKKGLTSLDQVGIYALNDTTLKVELEHPTPYFLDLTSFAAFFPIQSKKDMKDPHWSKKTGSHFVCNGPFTLKRWDKNILIELEKNPFYRDLDNIHLKKIQMHVIFDGMTALNMFENNDLDLLQLSLSPLPSEPLSELLKKGDLRSFPSATSQIIAFNTELFPFDHLKIRQAFSLAIDREVITNTILEKREIPAYTAIPPLLKKGENTPLIPQYDPQKASQLFEEALQELGLERWQFPPLTLTFCGSDQNKKIVETLQQQWKKTLGIHISLHGLDHHVFLDRLCKRRFQIAQTIWIAQYNDQMNFFERFKSRSNIKNYCGWENKDFSDLLERSFEETGEVRTKTLREAETLFLQHMPVTPLYHLNTMFLKKPYVKNLDSPYPSDLCFARIEP
jgi:oligopeptide transport system substrate-binding protein